MSVCPANNYTACFFFSVNNLDFFVLRTPEIATGIRISDFRPSCSCLFARQIITQLCLLAGMLSFAYFFSVNNYDFSVLRTPEIATGIRIPDFRPSCSCLFARQIITQLRLLAGMLSFAYFFSVNICDFSVLRTPEIATGIRIPDFRPSCSCLFARQIITQLRLLAGMLCNCLPGLFTHYITCFGTLYTGQTASVARFFIIFNSF
jgi:hypothetical protein